MNIENFVDALDADFFAGVPDSQLKALTLFEQFDCPFALKNMLRFVVHTGFPTPANNKETRNPVYLLMEQRSDRVDDISKSAVLQTRTICLFPLQGWPPVSCLSSVKPAGKITPVIS